MNGFLNLIYGKEKDTMKATYYERKPKTTQDKGVAFNYREVEQATRSEQVALGTLAVDEEMITIATRSAIDFKEHSFVVDHYGNLYEIITVATHKNEVLPQAFLLWKKPIGVEKTIRLIKKQNVWKLK